MRIYRYFRGLRSTRFLHSILLPLYFKVPLLRPNSRKKGVLIIKWLLRNLVNNGSRNNFHEIPNEAADIPPSMRVLQLVEHSA